MEIVAPIVPDAQKNLAPQLLLEGLRGGLGAMAQFASIRRQSEADVARLALQERLAEKEHDLQAQRLSMDYDIRDRTLKDAEEMMPYRKKLINAQSEYHLTTKGNQARKIESRLATLGDFDKRVELYGLNNPNPNPVEFYASARKLKDEFAWANIPEIKQAMKEIDRRTKEHTVPLMVNTPVKQGDGTTVMQPITKMVPIGEIVEGIKDPKKYDHVLKILSNSGMMDDNNVSNKFLRDAIQAETKKVESGKGTDFSRGRNRVRPGESVDAEVAAPMSEQDVQQEIDESELFGSIGQTEKYLTQAKAALRAGADPKAVAAKLQGEFGVDPSLLWS